MSETTGAEAPFLVPDEFEQTRELQDSGIVTPKDWEPPAKLTCIRCGVEDREDRMHELFVDDWGGYYLTFCDQCNTDFETFMKGK